MSRYHEYIKYMRETWGKELDLSCLEQEFRPYYDMGDKIRVRLANGDIEEGRVRAGYNPAPCFFLGDYTVLTGKDRFMEVVND